MYHCVGQKHTHQLCVHLSRLEHMYQKYNVSGLCTCHHFKRCASEERRKAPSQVCLRYAEAESVTHTKLGIRGTW